MLCCFAEFLKRTGVPEILDRIVTPGRKIVSYTATDYLLTLVLSVAVGCDYNVAINHLLRPYPQAARLLGMPGFPEQSSVSGFLHALTVANLEELDLAREECLRLFGASTGETVVDLDIDATGFKVYGDTYRGAAKGYFPGQRGEKGYQLGLVSAANSGEALADCFLPGNLRPEQLLPELIYGAAEALGDMERIGLITLDAGFGSEANIAELQADSLPYLVKGRDPRTFRKIAETLAGPEWDYAGPHCGVYELGLQRVLPKSKSFARTILFRYSNDKGEVDYGHFYTSLPESIRAEEVACRYNRREEIESVNKIVKNTLHAKHLRTRSEQSIEAFLKINLLTLNLLHAFRRLILSPAGLGGLGIRDIVCRLMPIPAKFAQMGGRVRLGMPAAHQFTEGAAVAARIVSKFSLKS